MKTSQLLYLSPLAIMALPGFVSAAPRADANAAVLNDNVAALRAPADLGESHEDSNAGSLEKGFRKAHMGRRAAAFRNTIAIDAGSDRGDAKAFATGFRKRQLSRVALQRVGFASQAR